MAEAAGGRLRALHQRIVQRAVQHGAQTRHLGAGAVQVLNADPERAAANLHEIAKRRDVHAEQSLAADRGLAAEQPHLDATPFVGAGEDRYQPVLEEIDMLDRDAGVLEHAAWRQRHPVEERMQPLKLVLRQRPQQEITRESRFPPSAAPSASCPVHIRALDIRGTAGFKHATGEGWQEFLPVFPLAIARSVEKERDGALPAPSLVASLLRRRGRTVGFVRRAGLRLGALILRRRAEIGPRPVAGDARGTALRARRPC